MLPAMDIMDSLVTDVANRLLKEALALAEIAVRSGESNCGARVSRDCLLTELTDFWRND